VSGCSEFKLCGIKTFAGRKVSYIFGHEVEYCNV